MAFDVHPFFFFIIGSVLLSLAGLAIAYYILEAPPAILGTSIVLTLSSAIGMLVIDPGHAAKFIFTAVVCSVYYGVFYYNLSRRSLEGRVYGYNYTLIIVSWSVMSTAVYIAVELLMQQMVLKYFSL